MADRHNLEAAMREAVSLLTLTVNLHQGDPASASSDNSAVEIATAMQEASSHPTVLALSLLNVGGFLVSELARARGIKPEEALAQVALALQPLMEDDADGH